MQGFWVRTLLASQQSTIFFVREIARNKLLPFISPQQLGLLSLLSSKLGIEFTTVFAAIRRSLDVVDRSPSVYGVVFPLPSSMMLFLL